MLIHEDPKAAIKLIKKLMLTGNIYAHLDKKSPIKISDLAFDPRVHVYKEFSVKWAQWSMVSTIDFLANKALENGATRITLISGVSYPIIEATELRKRMESEIDYFDANVVTQETALTKMGRRFTQRTIGLKMQNSFFPRLIRMVIRRILRLLSKLDFEKELSGLKLYVGSAYWSVTRETYLKSKELLQRNPNIESYFKKIEFSDESIFVTLFAATSTNHINQGTTFVKWSGRGRPLPLMDFEIKEQMRIGKYWFVRKIYSNQLKELPSLNEI